MARVRSVADWFSVRDPGWGRAQMARRTLVGMVAGMAAGYFVAQALGVPAVLGLVFGAILGFLPGLTVAGGPAELARNLPWFLLAFAVAQLVSIWLAPHKDAGLALLVVAAFLQGYLPRFGHAGHFFGIGLFAFYLNGLLTPISLQVYPRFLAAAAAAVAGIFLARAVLCWYRPARDLRRTQRAFQAACRRAASSAAEVLQGRDGASRQLERDLRRVNTVALIFDGRLGGHGVDGRFAEYLHRRVFDVEDTLVSLTGVIEALSAEQAPEAHAAVAVQMKALAAGRPADGAPLRAAAAALRASAAGGRACGLLGQAADELGAYQRSVQALAGDTDLAAGDHVTFKGVVALEGGVRPAGARPLARRAAAAAPHLWGLVPRPAPLTAAALQTAIATAIVLPLGYALDPQRYYWGVIGVLIIGAGVATSHEQGRKLLRRGVGTVLGAVIGIALHHLIGSAQADPWGTLAVIVVALSIGAYFIMVNYAAFVTCLVIALVQAYALTTPSGLDVLLAYRLGENLLGAAVGVLVALLVLPVSTRAVLRTGLHGYLKALSSFAANLGTYLADPGTDVRLRADSRALDHALFQTRLVVGHLVPHSARHQRADAVLGRLSGAARQVRAIVGHVPPSPGTAGTVTAVTPLIETLTTTIAALDRRVGEGGPPEPAGSVKHELTGSGKHVHGRRSRLAADDADLARMLTTLDDLDRCLVSIGAGERNLARQPGTVGGRRGSGAVNAPAQAGGAAVAHAAGSGTEIRGQVRDGQDSPVPHATLTLIGLGGRQLGRASAQQDGSYALVTPGAGSYVLLAAADGHQPQACTVVVGDQPVTFNITMADIGRLTGLVRSAPGAAPVAGALAAAIDARGAVVASATTGQDGTFGLQDLVAGRFTLAVSANGYHPTAVPVEVAATGTTSCEVKLRPGLRLGGTVRAGTAPHAGTRVTLLDAAGNVVGAATTGPDGTYEFTGLTAGKHTVIASGYPPVASSVIVDDRGESEIDLTFTHPDE